MAFPNQSPIRVYAPDFLLQPSGPDIALALKIYHAIRRNKGYLKQVLPEVVSSNRNPLATNERQRRLAEFGDREGYTIHIGHHETAVSGLVTLIKKKNPTLGNVFGVQVDYWFGKEVEAALGDDAVEFKVEVARTVVDRAFVVSEELRLAANPFAFLAQGEGLHQDPSRELSEFMTNKGPVLSPTRDKDFQGSLPSYDLYVADARP